MLESEIAKEKEKEKESGYYIEAMRERGSSVLLMYS